MEEAESKKKADELEIRTIERVNEPKGPPKFVNKSKDKAEEDKKVPKTFIETIKSSLEKKQEDPFQTYMP